MLDARKKQNKTKQIYEDIEVLEFALTEYF